MPTVKNPPMYGTTRPNMPAGASGGYPPQSTQARQYSQSYQPTQPVPYQPTHPARTGYSQPYAPIEAPYLPNAQPNPVPSAARARVARRSNTLMVAVVTGILGLGAVLAFMVLIVLLVVAPQRIANGVRVAGFDIGGQTLEDARASIANLPEPQVALTDGGRSFQVRLSDLGATIDVEASLDAAKAASANANIPPRLRVDLAQAQFGLVALADTVNIDALPGNPPQIGRSMDIPVMLDRLRADPTGELADGIFELTMFEVEPPVLLSGANANPDARTLYVVQPGQELALIAREFGVTLDDILQFNEIANPDLIYAGQELVIPAAGEYIPANVPPAPLAQGRSIVVSTGEQRIYAYENGQLVRTHLVSTGLADSPTVLGDYRIYVKYQATDMVGPGYFLPQVPYTMYFYQGYGIHGTYWHNSFGRPMSHGCVNLPTPEAEWFFNWADVGTMVRVI
ncbi:MAG: L,D-transpeptidase family protein [Anaerolineae bacterium]